MQGTANGAQEILERIGKRVTCGWCKHPGIQVYRAGLCRHCYHIKTELVRLHQKVHHSRETGVPHPRFGSIPSEWDLKYKIAIRMAESAQSEGRMYGSISRDEITNLRLEHEFNLISKRLLKRDLYRNKACLFECFTACEKRYVFYIISLMSREILRKNRRASATYDVTGFSVDDVLAKRSRGTFRVEET
jgi:hypothetical protein